MEKTLTQMMDILRVKFKITRPLHANSDINEIGLDSLDVINFLYSLEEETGVKIPDETIQTEDLRTLTSLAAYVATHASEARQ